MAQEKWIHELEKPFDTTPLHGRYCTINMVGQDVGYARVGILSSDPAYVLFRFRGRQGLASKRYITDIVGVRMTERLLAKEGRIEEESWDEENHPFARFVGKRCDIHMHQTRLFEATPGFFEAMVLYLDERNNLIRIRDESRQLNISIDMICGIMESKAEERGE